MWKSFIECAVHLWRKKKQPNAMHIASQLVTIEGNAHICSAHRNRSPICLTLPQAPLCMSYMRGIFERPNRAIFFLQYELVKKSPAPILNTHYACVHEPLSKTNIRLLKGGRHRQPIWAIYSMRVVKTSSILRAIKLNHLKSCDAMVDKVGMIVPKYTSRICSSYKFDFMNQKCRI